MAGENVPGESAPPVADGGRRIAPRAMAVVVMFVVLVAGFFAGVAVDRGYRHHLIMRFRQRGGGGLTFVPGESVPPPPPIGPGPGRPRVRPMVVDHFMRALDLTPAQASALDTIMTQDFAAIRSVRELMQPRVDSVVALTRQRIDSVLTPEQRERYHAMLDERQERIERRGRGAGSGGPPPAGP
jgi:hypothetical protein